jgi:hypothetical protein
MSVEVSAPEYAPRRRVRTDAVVEGSAPVLISAEEVKFATAAVLPNQRTAGTRWWTAIVRLFSTAEAASGSDDERRTPRVYPPRRYVFMEQAAMSRAMDRL